MNAHTFISAANGQIRWRTRPVGLAGFIKRLGATLVIGGTTCLLGSFLFMRKLPLMRKLIRPIYLEKGILLEKSETEAPPLKEGE